MSSRILTIFSLFKVFNYQNSDEFVDDDQEKCDLLNKYLSFISKSRYKIDKNNNIADLNVSVKEISDIIQILHANKASEPDVISHRVLKLCPSKIALPFANNIQ
jgi:hypothetical protein